MTPAELSSIGTGLDDLIRRLTAIAESAAGTDTDWVAQELFEAERALIRARRRVSAVTDKLR